MAVRSDTETRRYLLGLCPQAERERIESEYFQDGVAFQAMLTAEDDLIDAYARGDLTAEEQGRFETHFLTSARGRDRVQFARSFAGVASDASPAEMRPTGIWLNFFESLRGWPLRVATVAAVIVLVVAISWILVERKRMTNEVRDLRPEHSEVNKQTESFPRSAEAEQPRNAEATTQAEQPRAQLDKPRRQNPATHAQRTRHLPIQTVANRERIEGDSAGVAGRMLGADNRIPRDYVMYQALRSEQLLGRSDSSVGPTGGRKDQAGVTLDGVDVTNTQDATLGNTFVPKKITELPLNARNVVGLLSLQPGSSVENLTFSLEPRSSKRNEPTTITLASSIKSITLQLRLEAAKPHSEYRAIIKTTDDRKVTTLSWASSTLSNLVDTPALSTVDLLSGDYVLLLEGKISNGSFVRAAEYSFRVIRN